MNHPILAPRPRAAALSLFVMLILAGCNKPSSQAPEPVEKRAAQTTKETVPLALPDPKQTEADQAWRAFAKMMQDPPIPPSWKTNEPPETEVRSFRGVFAGKAADVARDFYTRFPEHQLAAAARQQEFQLLAMAVENGQTNRVAALLALEEAQLKDPKLTEEERLQLRVRQVQRSAMSLQAENLGPALDAMEKGVRTLQKEFPQRQELVGLLVGLAEARLDNNEVDKSRALAKEAQASEVEEIKENASALLKKIERVGQPLKLQFTAVDGREVDLEKLKGKVVLIDFWATWCKPCMAELPKVRAAYSQMHDQGFDIVGISLDKDGDALARVVQKEEMTWPQYLEEPGQENKFAAEFGIEGIPTMWLLDKKGVLRDLNARDGLAKKVEKLLAE